jgi:hypothetical protein
MILMRYLQKGKNITNKTSGSSSNQITRNGIKYVKLNYTTLMEWQRIILEFDFIYHCRTQDTALINFVGTKT